MNTHINQDYRVYIPEVKFRMHASGRPKADAGITDSAPSQDIAGASAQIDWYIDSDKKRIWLGKVGTDDPISKVFHEVIANKLYKDVFRNTKRVKVPRAVVSQVNIHEGYGVTTYGLKPGTKAFSIMSKKISEFREGGLELIDQLMADPRQPLTISNPSDPANKLAVTSLWSLAAYSKWFGDIDFLGTAGGNAGFQIKHDKETGEIYCRTVKIDAGFVGYGEGATETEIISKDMYYSTAGESIPFDTLLPEERKEFLETIQEIVHYTDREIKKLLSQYDTSGLTPEQIEDFHLQTRRLEEILIKRRNALKEVYKDELKNLPPPKKEALQTKVTEVDVVVNNLFKPTVGVIVSGLNVGIGVLAAKFGKLF